MPTPPPARYRLVGLLTKSIGDREQRAVKHSAIIAGQVDQTSLRNEAAKLD